MRFRIYFEPTGQFKIRSPTGEGNRTPQEDAMAIRTKIVLAGAAGTPAAAARYGLDAGQEAQRPTRGSANARSSSLHR